MQFLRVFFHRLINYGQQFRIYFFFLFFLFWIQLKYSNTLFFQEQNKFLKESFNNLLFCKAGDFYLYLFVAGAKNCSTNFDS